MALKLSLKPHERLVLNGAVLQNGDRRGVILLQNKASILREKDIMQEDEANSPSRRIYFAVMMMYIDEANAPRYHEAFIHRLQEFMGAIRNPDVLADCVSISRHALAQEYYKALMMCRKLIAYEDERLKDVAASLPADGRKG